MKTYIITAHEEQYSDKSRTLGVLLNVNDDNERVDSLTYVYHVETRMYILFNTIIELNEYLLYGDKKMKRAYITEDDFDIYYDSTIEGKFSEHLNWLTT